MSVWPGTTSGVEGRMKNHEVKCPNCGSGLVGNGVTRAVHCETIELVGDEEADSGPWYCAPNR